MKLSIAMIVKNEEKNLERTLKALMPLKEKLELEIVIVDTGSNDNTIEIAKKYTNKVYEHKWTGDFSEMRNISIKYCTGHWILVVDADEVLENPEEVIKFLNNKNNEKYNTAKVIINNITTKNEKADISAELYRLFKNNKEFCYIERIHEQPKVIQPVTETKISFLHYGYSTSDYNVMIYKYERNLEMLLKDLNEGKRPLYTMFQLEQTYSMANKDIKAFDIIKEAYNVKDSNDIPLTKLNMLFSFTKKLISYNNYELSIKLTKDIIKHNNIKSLDFYFILGNANYFLRRYELALKYFDLYLQMCKDKENNKELSINKENILDVEYTYDKKTDVINRYIYSLFELKKYKEVINKVEKSENKNLNKEVLDAYMYSLLTIKNYKKIKKYFKKDLEDSEIEKICSVIKDFDVKNEKVDIKKVLKEIEGVNDKLDLYIDLIYLDKPNYDYSKINFATFNNWKVEIIKELVEKDKIDLAGILINLDEGVIKSYVSAILSDYYCLRYLDNYSKDNFLEIDLKKLRLLTYIEEVLINSESIEEKEYKNLIYRTIINRLNYIYQIYNKEVLENNIIVLNRYNKLFIKIMNIINNKSNDKLKFIKELKDLLEEYKEYNKIINVIQDEINNIPITCEMVKEKENILKNVEVLVASNKIEEALEALKELNNIFILDKEVLSSMGTVYYLLQNNKEALFYTALSYTIDNKDFDTCYNLACILEAANKKDSSIYFFKKSYELCKDEELKKEILLTIENN